MANGNGGAAPVSRGPRIALWVITLLGLGLWIGVTIRGGFLAIQTGGPVISWAITIVITLAVLILAGQEINGQWLGVLIDNRNKYSLARQPRASHWERRPRQTASPVTFLTVAHDFTNQHDTI